MEVDVLILCRGGGSLEDLWAFNDERIVRAVAASPLPLICGVGHETDVTLADLAADVRAPTPTAAAELVAGPHAELLASLELLDRRAQRAVQRQIESRTVGLDRISLRLVAPAKVLSHHAAALESQQLRLQRAALTLLQRHARKLADKATLIHRAASLQCQHARARLDALDVRLQASDPVRVLKRGYTWVTDEAGRAIVSAHDLQPGHALHAVWADGHADISVLRVTLVPADDASTDTPTRTPIRL